MTPHPDDEQLSAHLDGQGTADVGAHVEGCPPCQARLAELRWAAGTVAAPVTPPSGPGRDHAVAAALDAWAEAAPLRLGEEPGVGAPAGQEGGDGDGRGWGPRLGEEPGVGAPGGQEGGLLPLRRRPRVPAWGVAAAAAVAGVLLAGTVVVTLDGDKGSDQTATAPRQAESFSAPDPALMRDGGDLGEQSDARLLAEAVRAGVGGTAAAAPPGPAAPSAASERAGGPAADAARTGAAVPPCAGEARDLIPGLGPLVYTATLRWQGTPAVALAFLASPSAGPGTLAHQLMVMAPQEGCRLLVVQRF